MIRLTDLLKEEKAFTATNKETGNVSVFKTKAARDAAVKAGSHEKRKTDKDDAVDVPTGTKKPNMFSKDTGYDTPDSDKKEPKPSTPKLDKDGDGGMSSDASYSVEKYLNKELGLDGFTNLNSIGAIEYNIPGSTDTLLIGDDEIDGKPFSVGLANEDGFDPDDTYKSFDNQKDAMAYAKELAQKLKDDKEKPKSEPYNQDADEKEFENALEGDGFSWYDGGSLDGVSTFGDDNGNTVAIASGDVYDSKSGFVVSGFNEDDPADVKGTKEFDSKEEALAYAKQLAQKLKSSNEGTIKLKDILNKSVNEARTVSKPIKVDDDTMVQIVGDTKGFRELTAALNPKTGKPIQKFGYDRGNEIADSKEELIKKLQKKYGKSIKFESVNEAKLLPKGTKVIITHPRFKGDMGMIIGTGLTNGAYTVQTNGKIKSIEPKYLKVDKPNTKKEERNLKNLAGVIKIDLSEALEMLEEGGVLEAIDHLEIAVERLQGMIKDLKRIR